MPKYQVMVIRWPERWKPECADDVPLELNGPVEVLVESDDLFTALDQAIEHNERRRGPTARPLGHRGRAGRHGPRLARRTTLHPGDLQSDRDLVARRLGAQLSVGRAQLRLEVARAGRRRVVRVSAGRSHRVGAEPTVHGPSGRVLARRGGDRERADLAHGFARSVRRRDHGRGSSNARHSSGTGRPRRVFALSRPCVPVRQGGLVEPNSDDVGPSQPSVRSDSDVTRRQRGRPARRKGKAGETPALRWPPRRVCYGRFRKQPVTPIMANTVPLPSPSPPLRAFLLGAGGRPDVLAEAERLRPAIERHAQIVRTDFTGAEAYRMSRRIWRSCWAAMGRFFGRRVKWGTGRYRFWPSIWASWGFWQIYRPPICPTY